MSLDLIRLKICIHATGGAPSDDAAWDEALEVYERQHLTHEIETAVNVILIRYHGLRGFTARVREIAE